MARKRSRDIDEEDDVEEFDAAPAPRSRRRRRKPSLRLRLLLILGISVALAVAAPTIVANTPLRNVVLSSAFPASAARLSAGAARFSWVSGQSLAGVTLADAAGAPIATVETFTIDRSLVALAANNRHLGKIVLTRPVVLLETRAGGSNIEELLNRIAAAAATAPPLPGDDGSTGSTTVAQIEIVEGTILGRDAATGQEWRIDQLNLTAAPNETGSWQSTGAGFISLASLTPLLQSPEASRGVYPLGPPAQPPADAGRFKFQLYGANTADAQQLDLIADRLPLAPLEPWLARVLPGARLLGVTSADLHVTLQNAGAGSGRPGASDGIAGPAPASSAPTPSTAFTTSAATAAPFPSAQTGKATAGFLPKIAATGKIDAAGVRFTADALAGDLVELSTASLAIDAAVEGSHITSRQFAARGDWFEVDATGNFDLAELTAASLSELPVRDAAVTLRVDLPQLARMLPHTLKLRPGVRIDSGKLAVSATSTSGDAARRWSLNAAVEDLLGADGARPIRWTQPIEAGVDLADSSAGPQLKRILLRAPFASISADGAAGGLEGQVDFNLADLAAQMGQFIDLTAWQMQGRGAGRFSWRDTGADKFAASASLDLAQIDVRRDGQVVWLDPDVHLELQSSGTRLGAQPLRVETASAAMRGPRDTLEVELLEPVDLASPSHEWFFRIKGDGPLDSWAGRARPWISAVPAELAGQSSVSARLRLSPGLLEITQSQLSVADFRTRLAGTELVEKRIEAGGDFRWDTAGSALVSQDLTIASSTIAARARGVEIRLADAGPPIVRGDVAFRGDLERIAAWLGMVGVDGGIWPRGQGVGRMQLASDAHSATAQLTLTAEPFTLVRSAAGAASPAPLTAEASRAAHPLVATIAWNEPKLELTTQVAYTHADDRLQLANLRIDGQTLQLTGGGAIEQLRTAGAARGEATLTYDSAELAKLLTTYLGPGIRIQGANKAHIVATGRLRDPASYAAAARAQFASSGLQAPASSLPPASHWSRRWQVTTEAGWTAANLYGLPIGAATLVANVRDGQMQLNPVDLAVGEGRLTAQSRALLDPPPQALQIAAGPLVSNVAVSSEVSDAMLKYAAPILANATRLSGNFSIITEGVQVPLGDPQKTAAKGRVTMHQLSILPGPGLADVVTLIQRLKQLAKSRDNLLGVLSEPLPPVSGITMNERTIDVQVIDGRVYHRNLEFLVDDVPVTSYGSVGFDQTIALVIRVPVQAKWVGREPALQGLVGQVIEIPVSGTFARWNIDERAVGKFLGQAAQTAVGGAIEGELNKVFDGLFKKK